MHRQYDIEVAKRFTIYNSLFLDLPFDDIYRTGTLLPLLSTKCAEGFEKGKTPKEIIQEFFEEMLPGLEVRNRHDVLFQLVQYIERQVVLFDAIEDAAFEKINPAGGKGSIKAFIDRAEADGHRQKLIEKLKTFSVMITLTAHPTQFYPGNVLGIITDLEAAIKNDDLESINQFLMQLGKTGFINKSKPSPEEEGASLLWYLENVFYFSIPDIVFRILTQLELSVHDWENTGLLQIGFWPGGDRDGNPFVTHEVTQNVADKLQRWILKSYYRDIRRLRRRLSFKQVEPLIQKAEVGVYQTLFNDEKIFTKPEDLLELLFEAREALIHYHKGLFLELLDQFILKVKIFGFHFASMDIRQDSRKHHGLWEKIMEKKGQNVFFSSEEPQQVDALFEVEELPDSFDDDFHAEMVEAFKTIPYIQQQNGCMGCHRYIISNCQSVLHMMEVFRLAQLTWPHDQQLPLDIVPLFETIEDLAQAPHIMRKLYQDARYSQHLQGRQQKQPIMLGFSDGTKDGGYIRANWSILRAKEELTKVSREFAISVVFFDGRGGPPARGGGNMHNFYASLGTQVENEAIQVTVQGQTISANYGNEKACTHNLEQLLSAGLENHIYPTPDKQLNKAQRDLLENLAQTSYEAYKDFKSHPQFVPYLENISPLRFFGEANIGSRPVKRNKSEAMSFDDLRAIPFVGAWAQMKQNIPGFYGIGAAIAYLEEQGKMEEVKELYKDSLFFRTLLGNSMQSMAKSNYAATAYLKEDGEYGEFWQKMHQEYQQSVASILQVSQLPTLLADNPVIQKSIEIREKIVLPLITIQQYAIQLMREIPEGKDTLVFQKLILRSMFGIINAARNAA